MLVRLPVQWEVSGFVEVEANSIEEALEVFDETADDIPLPTDSDYIDGSFCLVDGDNEYYACFNDDVPINKNAEEENPYAC